MFRLFLTSLLFISCVHKDVDDLGRPKLHPNDRRSPVDVAQEKVREEEMQKTGPLVNPALGVTQLSKNCQSWTIESLLLPYSCKHEWVVHMQLHCKLTGDQAIPDFIVPLRYKDIEIDIEDTSLKEELKQKFPLTIQTGGDGALQFTIPSSGIRSFNFLLRRNGIEVKVSEEMLKTPVVLNMDFCGTKK